MKQLDALPSDPAAAAAIRSLLGESEAGTSAEEIAWAFRKLLEEQAPLVVVFDDIQWGEETFLDLVEHVALLSSGAPLLLSAWPARSCSTRRPSWPVAVRLEPLSAEDAASLIGAAVPEELRARIAAAAGGNPLFIGEMLAMADEAGDEVEVPPTLKALLAARLDQLDAAERRVLERGAVEGEVFHRGAVQALGPEETQVTPRLAALVRRELIRPDTAQFAREDGFRFRHLLIRDAAYDALPKASRAELHERFADWLEQRGEELVELDEILGYHLEQAARYRQRARTARHGPGRARGRAARGRRPARALARRRAGRRRAARAGARADPAGAAGRRARARPRRGALRRDAAKARSDRRGRRRAGAGGRRRDRRGARPRRRRLLPRRSSRPIRPSTSWRQLAREALPLLEQAEDHAGLVHVWDALGYGVANWRGHFEDYAHASEQALRHARLAGQRRSRSLRPRPGARLRAAAGGRGATHDRRAPSREPAPLAAADARLAAHDARPLRRGSADRARGRRAVARADRRRLGRLHARLHRGRPRGDHEAAAVYLRRFCDFAEAGGAVGFLQTYAPLLGRSLCALGRHDEAEPLARARPRARRDDAGHLHAGALAAGAGARPREPRPPRRGGDLAREAVAITGTARTR